MNISARNVFKDTITTIIKGAVNAEVELQLDGGNKIICIITIGSVEKLGLKEGMVAYAMKN